MSGRHSRASMVPIATTPTVLSGTTPTRCRTNWRLAFPMVLGCLAGSARAWRHLRSASWGVETVDFYLSPASFMSGLYDSRAREFDRIQIESWILAGRERTGLCGRPGRDVCSSGISTRNRGVNCVAWDLYYWAGAEYHLGLALAMNVGLPSYMETRLAAHILAAMPAREKPVLGVKTPPARAGDQLNVQP